MQKGDLSTGLYRSGLECAKEEDALSHTVLTPQCLVKQHAVFSGDKILIFAVLPDFFCYVTFHWLMRLTL